MTITPPPARTSVGGGFLKQPKMGKQHTPTTKKPGKKIRFSKLAEAENIERHKADQDRTYGPDFETFTK